MIEALDIYPCLLPSIALPDRDFLPDCRAIYFIPAGQEVIYIGKDHCPVARWEKHQKLGELASLEDVRIAWLVCSGLSNEELFRKEPEYILHSRPRLDGNRTHRPIHLCWS